MKIINSETSIENALEIGKFNMKLIDEDDERFKGLDPAVKSQLIYMNEAMGKLVNELNQLKSVDIANNK